MERRPRWSCRQSVRKRLGLKPLVRYVSFATAGYKPEEMGLGPVFAIPKALRDGGA